MGSDILAHMPRNTHTSTIIAFIDKCDFITEVALLALLFKTILALFHTCILEYYSLYYLRQRRVIEHLEIGHSCDEGTCILCTCANTKLKMT